MFPSVSSIRRPNLAAQKPPTSTKEQRNKDPNKVNHLTMHVTINTLRRFERQEEIDAMLETMITILQPVVENPCLLNTYKPAERDVLPESKLVVAGIPTDVDEEGKAKGISFEQGDSKKTGRFHVHFIWEITHKWNDEWANGKKGIKMGDFIRAMKNYLKETMRFERKTKDRRNPENKFASPYLFIRVIDSRETYLDYITKERKTMQALVQSLKDTKISNSA